ncbi:asparagine synthase (glutamine-hydrolyzing) [Chromobacterium sp. Panama]|uniref:asparagine synthase (glutamine-hydrolyzing) n=1 Tax=Chromobacterium sp. Panama TaxID=2161826 RepID=UPI000D3173EB|nr:asparagine synthase (glutamine-hydrolyzing) [Chromobacterium sp. Panama]PTU66617.1 asparagine synthase (glutamine-hydrolyzing) [Chromobacterium sp. Panama]
MCGIAGIFSRNYPSSSLLNELKKMLGKISHRGPDAENIWSDNDINLHLGHRRLSIFDLSESGSQPMMSQCGRYIVTYNGEIYNFEQLRDELNKARGAVIWRGHSDTEVLVECLSSYGMLETIAKLTGMFSIAIYDRHDKCVYLVRDRMGEKPLYYGMVNGRFVFSSELKAIVQCYSEYLSLDLDSTSLYMSFGYVGGGRSIYKEIKKLPPSSYIKLDFLTGLTSEVAQYWNIAEYFEKKNSYSQELDEAQYISHLDKALNEVIKRQAMADVPLGAFLSGGVDSSLVSAIMQSQSDQPIKTFTIGFDEKAYNEAPYAKAVAKHLGTDHTELFVHASDALKLIEELPSIYDEPFADSSQMPTLLVSRMTKQYVTVALSGDGGDELFSGYPRYELCERLWKKLSNTPYWVKSSTSAISSSLSPLNWDKLLKLLPSNLRSDLTGRRISGISEFSKSTSLEDLYLKLMTRWKLDDHLVIGSQAENNFVDGFHRDLPDIDQMRLWDIQNYLPDDLLVKVDRASMNASLEIRAPLLDHKIAEFAASLPRDVLLKNGKGKWILRKLLDKYVPRELIERPKTGFEVPLALWLRGDLKGWAQDVLDPVQIKKDGIFDYAKVSKVWNQHQSGHYDRSLYLWHVLMFQAWRNSNR